MKQLKSLLMFLSIILFELINFLLNFVIVKVILSLIKMFIRIQSVETYELLIYLHVFTHY